MDKDGKAMEEARGKRMRRGVLWAITGDLEWFASEFGFPYRASNLLCPYCLANHVFPFSWATTIRVS